MATDLRIAIGMAIGGLLGATLGVLGYVAAFRNDGNGTLGLLLAFGSLLGGVPGLLLGVLFGGLVARSIEPPKNGNDAP
jgi:hypothetical protein